MLQLDILAYDLSQHVYVIVQNGLYDYVLRNVNSFRDFLRIPNTERYNFVLFGGKTYM